MWLSDKMVRARVFHWRTSRSALWGSFAATILLLGCANPSRQQHVVAYISVDQVYAEPVLKAFERKTGIRVDAVFDVEANKVTGLANRIIAESRSPKAGVFWNGEFVQTIRLAEKSLLTPYRPISAKGLPPSFVDPSGLWTGVTPRIRVWVAAKDFTSESLSFEDISRTALPGNRIAISNPVFGTGATQAAALYSALGAEKAKAHYQSIVDKQIRIVDGNGVVRDLVVSGDVTLGLTDSDDACAAVKRKANIRVFAPKQTLLFPASVAMVSDSPEARSLIEFLVGPEAEAILVEAGFSQVVLHKQDHQAPVKPCLDIPAPVQLHVSPQEMARQIDRSTRDMKELFLR